MPQFKPYNQNQALLLPPQLTEWLPKNHICYVINDVVEQLDMSEVEKTYSEIGCPGYNPRALIKLLFFSYARGIRSSRKIEELSHESVAYRYLSGNQQPDHGTISLFRKKHLESLEGMFASIVMLCDGLGIIGPRNISID